MNRHRIAVGLSAAVLLGLGATSGVEARDILGTAHSEGVVDVGGHGVHYSAAGVVVGGASVDVLSGTCQADSFATSAYVVRMACWFRDATSGAEVPSRALPAVTANRAGVAFIAAVVVPSEGGYELCMRATLDNFLEQHVGPVTCTPYQAVSSDPDDLPVGDVVPDDLPPVDNTAVILATEPFGSSFAVYKGAAARVTDTQVNGTCGVTAVAPSAVEPVDSECWVRSLATGETVPTVAVAVGTAPQSVWVFTAELAPGDYELCLRAKTLNSGVVGPTRCAAFT